MTSEERAPVEEFIKKCLDQRGIATLTNEERAFLEEFVKKCMGPRPMHPPSEVDEIRRQKREELAAQYNLNQQQQLRLLRIKGNYLYTTWWGIVQRCNYSWRKDHRNYGGRGIQLCLDWDNACTWGFEAFAAYVIGKLKERPRGCTIDRINVWQDYELGNI